MNLVNVSKYTMVPWIRHRLLHLQSINEERYCKKFISRFEPSKNDQKQFLAPDLGCHIFHSPPNKTPTFFSVKLVSFVLNDPKFDVQVRIIVNLRPEKGGMMVGFIVPLRRSFFLAHSIHVTIVYLPA